MPKLPTDYEYSSYYFLIDAYEFPDDIEDWLPCPRCNLKPKVWRFDNGVSTGCGCHNSQYDHFSIGAESISSIYKRTGSTKEHSRDQLRINWNHFVTTGEFLWDNKYSLTGRW